MRVRLLTPNRETVWVVDNNQGEGGGGGGVKSLSSRLIKLENIGLDKHWRQQLRICTHTSWKLRFCHLSNFYFWEENCRPK